VNYRVITNVLGRILLIESGLLAAPMMVSLLYQENTMPFVWTILIVLAVGGLFMLIGQGGVGLHPREGFVSVTLSWILISLFGALPFLFSGAIPDPIDALFEIVSGFTTTGASILSEVESLPKGILFWRSFSHFLGGMGVLVFMMAILPMDNEHSMHLLRAEVPGPVKGKLVPKMRTTARILYIIYSVMTLVETIFLLCGGMNLFDALVTAFGTAGTGGFAVRNASIAAYNSPYIEMVVAVFMLLFGINFNLYYIVLLKRSLRGFKSEELLCYLVIALFSTVTIAWNILPQYGTIWQSLRYAFFQVSSIITSTGYGTTDFNLWPSYSRTLLVLLMVIGACAGSTGGGTKVSRLVLMAKTAWNEIHHQLFPRSVGRITLDGERVEDKTLRSTMVFYVLYAMVACAATLLLSLEGFDLETTLTSVISCLSNIGPGLNLVGPAGNYGFWSGGSKLLLCLCMLLGRLEIFPVIMLFAPGVWVGRKKQTPHFKGLS
jgi:trk system potassium uptake protein TrkH